LPPEEPPLEAALRHLARTPCVLAGIQFEDAAGELNQANMPGLDAGHPNWRRRLGTDVETLTAPGGDLARLAAAMQAEGRGVRPRTAALAAPPPRATYRLQFHKSFTFDDATRIVPYLARLGISHVYSSPIHTARPGSTHGYDIVDHSAINPELGGEEGFEAAEEPAPAGADAAEGAEVGVGALHHQPAVPDQPVCVLDQVFHQWHRKCAIMQLPPAHLPCDALTRRARGANA